ncbi:MAG: AraC family transcriptional regulator [Ruminococcaceae bacterium]|nr:AraC family transcriptional regulator [Oscillospiraceae bacterium]
MEYLQDVFVSNLNATIHNGGFISFFPEDYWKSDFDCFNQNKFYCITRGSCTITIAGNRYHATAGDWFFIPRQTVHSFEKDDDDLFEKYWLHFDIYPTDENLFSLLNLPYFVKVEKDDPALSLFDVYTKTKGKSITDILKIKSCILSLLGRYIELSEKRQFLVKSRTDDRLDHLLRYIHSHLDKTISNDELSALCHLHTNHFIRFFKEHTGQTPIHYIRCCKMDTAKRLLENSDLNISEIMLCVGFDDISYFSKQFKIFYGMSPREYRKYYKFHLKPAKDQL